MMEADEKLRFFRAMVDIMHRFLDDTLSLEATAQRLKSGAAWLIDIDKRESEGIDPPKKSQRLGPSMAEVRDVYDHWITTTGRNPKVCPLTPTRKGAIRGALSRGHTVEQLKHITEWAVVDPWYSGSNPQGKRYDWPENMYRPSNLEKNLEISNWGECEVKGEVVELSPAREIKRLEQLAMDAHREGNHDEYERLQECIRTVAQKAK